MGPCTIGVLNEHDSNGHRAFNDGMSGGVNGVRGICGHARIGKGAPTGG
jgi:hypothetical protein